MVDATGFRPQDETLRILTALMESSDDAILAKDLQGTILSCHFEESFIF